MDFYNVDAVVQTPLIVLNSLDSRDDDHARMYAYKVIMDALEDGKTRQTTSKEPKMVVEELTQRFVRLFLLPLHSVA